MQPLKFEDQFFSQSMNQVFNNNVRRFVSDEDEPALIKYLRSTKQL